MKDLGFISPSPMPMRGGINQINNRYVQPTDVQSNSADMSNFDNVNSFRGMFETAGGIVANRFGFSSDFGRMAARSILTAGENALSRSRKQNKTAMNARRRSNSGENTAGDPTSDRGRNNNNNKTDQGDGNMNNRRRKNNPGASDDRWGGRGSSASSSNTVPNIQIPVLDGHLTTIEGGPMPNHDQTIDYVSQLSTTILSFSTWSSITVDPILPNIYDETSIKAKQLPLLFSRLLNDLLAQTTTKFTDEFTLSNFKNYMQAFTQAIELIAHVESVLAYNSRIGYADKVIANEYLQSEYTSYAVSDGLTRLKSVLKNKYYPPKMVGMIHSCFQLYKMSDLEQSANFRFTPRSRYIFQQSTGTGGNVRDNIVTEIEDLISVLSNKNNTLISKAIGFIRPNFMFTTMPAPTPHAVYDPNMVELFINLPRVYLAKSTDTNLTVFPNKGVLEDIPYVLNMEVDKANATVFALQPQPKPIGATSTTFSDVVNFATTYPVNTNVNGGVLSKTTNTKNFDNSFTFVTGLNNKKCWYAEDIADSYCTGKLYSLQNDTSGFNPNVPESRTSDPTKFSITPPNSQRVYFNNSFAPTDAVRKLVDDVFDYS